MKKVYALVASFAMVVAGANAQFTDDMEGYTDGSPIYQDHWTDWACGGTCAIISSSAQAQSGSLSGYVPGDESTDGVLDLGNQIFGEWSLQFSMYVPSGKEAYFNLQGQVPIGAGEWIVGNFFFNQELGSPGEGMIDDPAPGPTTFNFPHDQWFDIVMNFDISGGIDNSTWQCIVDGTEVIPAGTAFTNSGGTYPTALGGIDFFSISADNEYWIDDFTFEDTGGVGIDGLSDIGFSAYPNPVVDVLTLEGSGEMASVTIHNIMGQQVYSKAVNASSHTIDMAGLNSGVYFVVVKTADSEGVVKVIK